MSIRRGLPIILLTGLALAATAGEAKKSRAEQMDYGPVITATLGLGKQPAAGAVNKGVVVRLGREKPAHACFDSEGLRLAAWWTDGSIDFTGLAFKGGWDNARGPNIAGTVRATTRSGPGWDVGHGFADPRANGDGPLPREWGRYRGYFMHGEQVVFSATIAGSAVLELPGVRFAGELAIFTRTVRIEPTTVALRMLVAEQAGATGTASAAGATIGAGDGALSAAGAGLPAGAGWVVEDGRLLLALPVLKAPTVFRVALAATAGGPAALAPALAGDAVDPVTLTKGGPPRWPQTVTTAGVLGKDEGGFALDTLTLPEANPWNAWMRPAAFDFFSDGRIAFCTWSGDVWVGSGVDDGLGTLTWRRFASGLFQPLGLRIVDDRVYVLCHGPIMRLHDLDHDGEADFYECFNNDCAVTNSYHEFACDLQSDHAGSFWFTKGAPALVGRKAFERYTAHHGALLTVSQDGEKLEVVATGFREPNGVCVDGPGGLITVSDNQGNWQPESPLNAITPGGFYGMPDPASKAPRPQRDPPLCWIPYGLENSAGGQVWVTGEKWAALKGVQLLTSYGKCALFAVLPDAAAAGGRPAQAAVTAFPFRFASGMMRARFSPRDGQLYLCGLRGWGTAASKDGALQRVRATGTPVRMPVGWRVRRDGIDLTWSCALDPQAARDPGSYGAEWFNVVESVTYGSPEFSVADPAKQGRDKLAISAATLSADGRTVSLAIAGLKPVTNLVIKARLQAADGTALTSEIAGTINRLP